LRPDGVIDTHIIEPGLTMPDAVGHHTNGAIEQPRAFQQPIGWGHRASASHLFEKQQIH
jgi:hypothetical protein